MAQEGFKRKLTAILSADAVGYSRLMAEDETATVKTIAAYRGVMTSLIKQHRGRVVDSPGDNLLAEFSSVVDAVQCAVAVQNEFQTRNAEFAENRRMIFRIGINLGDVIDEEDRIYGDGVNVAARLEALADPGGICVSKTAFDQIETKLPLGYEYLGEQSVKNIPRPVGAYRVLMKPRVTVASDQEKEKPAYSRRKPIILSAVAVFMVVVAVGIWQFSVRFPSVEPASVEKMAFPLPDKPSIAVIPFVNMSDDPKQEYFSDGITEDIITDLSAISGLFVIARNSTFAYKGKRVRIRQVAEELGVRYVLEGSVRKVDDKIRINAQLIDATTGGHLWAKRYDGMMKNVFALQDKITQKIVAALEVTLTADEKKQAASQETSNPIAYEAFLKGWAHYRRQTPQDFVKAIHYLDEAVERDPNYSRAYAALAAVYWESGRSLWGNHLDMSEFEAMKKADIYLVKAMQDPTPLAHLIASEMKRVRYQHQESITEATRAIALDANNPIGYFAMADALIWAGNPADSVEFIKKAMRLDPHYPPNYLFAMGKAQFFMGRYDEAAATLEEIKRRYPDYVWTFFFLAATYGHLGREQEAKSAIKTFYERMAKSNFRFIQSLQFINIFPFKEPHDAERLREGLRIAGVPERPSG